MIPRHSLELLELRLAPAGLVVDAIDVTVDHLDDFSAAAAALGPDFAPDDLVAAPLDPPTVESAGFSLFDLSLDTPVASGLVASIASIISASQPGGFGSAFGPELALANLAVSALPLDLVGLEPAAPLADFAVGSVIIVEAGGLTGAAPDALLIVNL